MSLRPPYGHARADKSAAGERSRGLLRHREEIVHIFDRPICFLPELKLHRGVELGKSCVEMVLKGVGVGEVDGMLLMRVFRDISQVEAERLAESAELDLALMFKAELERLLCDLLIAM